MESDGVGFEGDRQDAAEVYIRGVGWLVLSPVDRRYVANPSTLLRRTRPAITLSLEKYVSDCKALLAVIHRETSRGRLRRCWTSTTCNCEI